MARRPTIKQLNYLLSVAEHRHFGKAAKACHVSQSTLSSALIELEDLLGAALVERSNRQVILTALGEDVVELSRQVLLEIDDLQALCAASSEPFNGKMRLGVIPTIAPFVLPGLLNQLRRQYPDFQLFIREDLSAPLVDALQHGHLDVLLLALPYPVNNVATMHLFNDKFLFACAGTHPMAKNTKLSTRDLRSQDLLLLEDGHCLRDHALEACRLRGSQLNIPYQATSLNTIVQMVANGIGVTLLPQMAVDARILTGTDVQTRQFREKNVARSIGLMWRKKTPRVADFRALGEFISGR